MRKLYLKTTRRAAIIILSIISFVCINIASVSYATAQTAHPSVRGTVVDADSGAPLLGAGIVVKDRNMGAITDIDGNFSINAAPDAVLIVSCLGYQSVEIGVNNRTNIRIQLEPDAVNIGDLVVVGYGVQRKVNLTAAVGTVSPQDLAGKPVNNVVEALQGTIAGLSIRQQSSEPNSRPDIKIRGYNTLNNNEPLVLIDGVIGDIQNINPSDIDQISVLKDAAATAIYGSRGASGVLLVTTKMGSAGHSAINYEFRLGWQQATELPAVVNSWEYMELRNEALVNSGMSPEFSADQIHRYRYGANMPNTNWLAELYRVAPQQSHNLSVTGSNNKTSYLISAGYVDQESMFKGPGYGMKKYMFRTNLSTQYSKRLKVDTHVTYARTATRTHAYWSEWIIEGANRQPPINDIKNPDGSYNYPNGLSSNPLARLETGGYTKTGQDDLNGSVRGEYQITNALKVTGMSAARLSTTQTHINRIAIPSSTDLQNVMQEEYYRELKVTTNLLLEYGKSFDKHRLEALGGFTYEGLTDDYNYSRRTRDQSDKPHNGDDVYGSETPGDTKNVVLVYGTRNVGEAIYSGIARVRYNYDERYLVEFNARQDFSSKFAKGYRGAFFPSVSAGWRISEENFFGGMTDYIPSLKLRASWGLVGNNTVGNFQYMSMVGTGTGYVFNNTGATTAGFGTANKELTWETTRMANIGIDLGLFRNTFEVTFDLFDNMTRDILIGSVPTSGIYGTNNEGAPANMGKVRNSGWELSLSYQFRTGEFNHRVLANLSDTWNEIVYLPEDKVIWGADPKYINQIGYPMNSYYGYKSDGFFANETEVANGPNTSSPVAPGDIRYVDKNGDNNIRPDDDYFVLGNNQPHYMYGFTYGVEWKGIDFSMFWQGVGRRQAWLRGEAVEAFHNNNNGPVFEFHKNRWTPGNAAEATYPRLTVGSASANNALPSDFWIMDASYLRLKNVQVGYTFPTKMTKKIMVEQFRIFATMQNALTLSPMNGIGWDPEYIDGTGRIYPVARVMAFGLDIRF